MDRKSHARENPTGCQRLSCPTRHGSFSTGRFARLRCLQSRRHVRPHRAKNYTNAQFFFDFPRTVPDHLFYTQPWVTDDRDDDLVNTSNKITSSPSFPWHKLDGRPIVYVSLGTVQNGFSNVYCNIAKACYEMPRVQMILSFGKKGVTTTPPEGMPIPQGAIFCDYAPQVQLLKKATLMVCVGGMNTILEALREGVPMVTIPLGSDQPSNAARAKRLGAVELVTQPTAPNLKKAMEKVLAGGESSSYRQAALECQRKLSQGPTVAQTAALIEAAFEQNEPLKRDSEVARNIYGRLGDPIRTPKKKFQISYASVVVHGSIIVALAATLWSLATK